MDEDDIIGALLSRVAGICEDVEVIVVGTGIAADSDALAAVRAKLLDAVALLDGVLAIAGEQRP